MCLWPCFFCASCITRWLSIGICTISAKCSASFWSPYIETLPVSFDLPLHFSPSQMQQLQATSIFSQSLALYKGIVRQYCKMYLLFHVCLDSYLACATYADRKTTSKAFLSQVTRSLLMIIGMTSFLSCRSFISR
jgi:hypothetical protein